MTTIALKTQPKIHFHPTEGPRLKATLPSEDADHVVVQSTCPVCKASPMKVAGVRGSMVRGHDTFTSDAGCIGCKTVLGRLVLTVSTIFGIDEDERVLGGRCRVY